MTQQPAALQLAGRRSRARRPFPASLPPKCPQLPIRICAVRRQSWPIQRPGEAQGVDDFICRPPPDGKPNTVRLLLSPALLATAQLMAFVLHPGDRTYMFQHPLGRYCVPVASRRVPASFTSCIQGHAGSSAWRAAGGGRQVRWRCAVLAEPSLTRTRRHRNSGVGDRRTNKIYRRRTPRSFVLAPVSWLLLNRSDSATSTGEHGAYI
jgi:hypothetical protein